MNYLEQMIPSIRKAVKEGYYELGEPERERKSLVEAIEQTKAQGRRPLIPEVKFSSPDTRLALRANPAREADICLAESAKSVREADICLAESAKSVREADKGLIAREDAEKWAEKVIRKGACGLSIVTEPTHFGGELELLLAEWEVPAIMRDFVIDEKQIRYGDAAFLNLALLDLCDIDENDFIEIAHEREIETVLEVMDLAEFRRAKKTETDIICINNRDLRTFRVDLGLTAEILQKEKSERTVISASGVQSGADVKLLLDAGADAVLVGNALLEAKNPEEKMGELLGEQG